MAERWPISWKIRTPLLELAFHKPLAVLKILSEKKTSASRFQYWDEFIISPFLVFVAVFLTDFKPLFFRAETVHFSNIRKQKYFWLSSTREFHHNLFIDIIFSYPQHRNRNMISRRSKRNFCITFSFCSHGHSLQNSHSGETIDDLNSELMRM